MNLETWDYIVVGGGHNGLSAACTLASKGESVLLLERLPILGGLSASAAYLPEAPDHVLSLGAMDDMFMAGTSLTQDLDLQRYGHSASPLEHPYGWIGEDGETLLLFRDYSRTEENLRRFSPRDARAFAEVRPALDFILDLQDLLITSHPGELPKRALLRKFLQLAPDRAVRRQLAAIATSNLVDFVADTFESDQMRALCTYWASMIGPIDADATAFYTVGLAAVSRKQGVMRPRGGMGGMMNAFASHLTAHGGEIRTGVGVDRVLVEAGRAIGVRLTNGSVLGARRGVLASVAPQLALGSFLDRELLDSATRAKVAMIPASGNNSATLKIDMAVAGRAGYPLAEAARKRYDGADIRRTALMTGTFEDQIAQLKAIRQGEMIASPPVYMAVLSASDSSIAPEGQDVVYLASNVPANPQGGWAGQKDDFTKLVLGSVERHMSGLEHEIGRVITSPADLAERYGASGGCYFHVDMTPFRALKNRPGRGLGGYTTPIDGYYLAGAGSHPGGGVSGWPGRLAAETALKNH